MNTLEVIIFIFSLGGLVVASQLLYKRWDRKDKERKKGDFHY